MDDLASIAYLDTLASLAIDLFDFIISLNNNIIKVLYQAASHSEALLNSIDLAFCFLGLFW